MTLCSNIYFIESTNFIAKFYHFYIKQASHVYWKEKTGFPNIGSSRPKRVFGNDPFSFRLAGFYFLTTRDLFLSVYWAGEGQGNQEKPNIDRFFQRFHKVYLLGIWFEAQYHIMLSTFLWGLGFNTCSAI